MAGPPDPLNPKVRWDRAAGWLLSLGSAAAILFVTLVPSRSAADVVGTGLCIICGEFGLANLVRNVVLFVPLGLGLGLLSRRFLAAWMPAVALTAVIESAQFFIPGRNPLLVDLVSNATGGALGILFVYALVRPSERGETGIVRGMRSSLPWWGLATMVLAGTALSFQLAPPSPPHFNQVQANLGHLDRYAGSVDSVALLDDRLTTGRHPDPARLEGRLFGGAPLRVDFVRGPDPARIAPLYSVYTGQQREVFLVGVSGTDLVLRIPYRAAQFRLDRPDHRLRGALAGIPEGEALRVTAWSSVPGAPGRGDGGACLRLERRTEGSEDAASPGGGAGAGPAAGAAGATGPERIAERCGLRPTMGRGWLLLLFPARAPEAVHRALTWIWLLGLGFVPALLTRSVRGVLAGGGLLLATAVLAPRILGSLAHLPVTQALPLLGGVALGYGAGHLLRSRLPFR